MYNWGNIFMQSIHPRLQMPVKFFWYDQAARDDGESKSNRQFVCIIEA